MTVQSNSVLRRYPHAHYAAQMGPDHATWGRCEPPALQQDW